MRTTYPNPSAYTLEEIQWNDAKGVSQWTHLDDVRAELAPCVSVGYCIRENDDAVVLAATLSDDELVNDIQWIPKSWITKRTVLRKRESLRKLWRAMAKS